MGQLIEFGQKVQKIGIEKFDCAQGVTVRAALLNYARPYVRNLAWDELNKCTVECTREMAIKYSLNPSPRYFFLVAAFATDLNGNVIGDKEVKVTYMQMKDQQYNRFCAASNNLGEWNGLVTLSKVQKTVEGRDFSYVEAIPAADNAKGFNVMSQALKDRIAKLSADENVINTSVQMIDAATGYYEDKYLERIAQNKQQAAETASVPQSAPQAAVPQAAPQQAAQQPKKAAIPQTAQPTAVAPSDDITPVDGDDLPFN